MDFRGMTDSMDKLVVGKNEGWMRISLGNLLTVGAMVAGFLLTNQATADRVANLQNDITDLKASVKAIELSENTSTLTLRDVQAKQAEYEKSQEYINKRFEGHDSRLSALESQISTLNTNLQLVNQQLQYIGTSHIVTPSTKK
jgi:septal ring factor EnvC (AmiA/AmiB activator)